MDKVDVRAARASLGEMWGLGRPLKAAELGRVLGLRGRDPGAQVLRWERGDDITGPVRVALSMMLAGAVPPTRDRALMPPPH